MSRKNGKPGKNGVSHNGDTQSGESGTPNRDSKGRLLPGHSIPGPGRPRGISVQFLVDTAMENGENVPEQLWEVIRAMFKRATEGDVNAARLLLDKLAPDRTKNPAVHIDARGGDVKVTQPPDGENLREWLRRLNALGEGLLEG